MITMEGLALMNGLQPSSIGGGHKDGGGRGSSAGFFGGEVTSWSRYASCRRLGLRMMPGVNYERVSLGFAGSSAGAGEGGGVVVVRAARSGAAECMESPSDQGDPGNNLQESKVVHRRETLVQEDWHHGIGRGLHKDSGSSGSNLELILKTKMKGLDRSTPPPIQLHPGKKVSLLDNTLDEMQVGDQFQHLGVENTESYCTDGSQTSKEENGIHRYRAKEATKDVKLTIQRVLEARALLADKQDKPKPKPSPSISIDSVQKDLNIKNINMAREVLAGYKKGSKEKGRLFEERTVVQDWGASLARSGLPKPLTRKGSLWRRDLGSISDQQVSSDQPDIVRKVVGALSGIRSSNGVTSTMHEFVGRVTLSDLQQVLHGLGVMKDWLTALQMFEWMQTTADYKPDPSTYRTVINLLANARRMDVAEAIFDDFVKGGTGPSHEDFFVLIAGYIRCGSLQRGVTTLEKMKLAGVQPLVSVYNILLDGCTKSVKGLEIAAQLLDQMRRENVVPDRTTYTCMILMYCRKGWHEETVQTFEQMRLSSCVPDKTTYNTILTAYSKLGDIKGMMDAHRHMMEHGIVQDAVSFNVLLNTLSRLGRIRDVGRYWALMRKGRVMPDLTTCSILINAFGRAREWDEVDVVLVEMERLGLQADLTVYNSLISVYGKAGLFYEVELIVKSLKAEITRLVDRGNSTLSFDLITYNTLLDVYGKAGRLNDVIHWFADMKKAGVQPDVKTFNSLVNAYGKASHFDGVKEVLELFQNYNYKPDLVFYNTLVFMFGRGGHYADGWKILEDMKQAGFAPTVETYNSLILVFGRGSIQQGLEMFADMIKTHVEPNVVTFKLLMDIHSKKGLVDDCLKIYYESSKHLNIKCEESLLSAAFGACCNMRAIEKAEKLIMDLEAEGICIPLACYNWLILGYGKKGQWQEAENVFERIKAKKLKPSAQSVSFLLEAYSLSGQIPKGEKLISKLKADNAIAGTPGYNALLRFYARAGDIGSALQTYELLQTRGPKPNQSTYVPMIEALVQEGAVDERFWGIMQDLENAPFEAKYAIHSAMLQALARCGQSKDAGRLLETLERLGCPTEVCTLLKEGEKAQNGLIGEDAWNRLTALFSSMEREGINLEAGRNFHNGIIDVLWSFEYEMRALKVTELSVTLGVFGSNVCEWKEDSWTLDVRYAGAGAAQILLLTWLAGIRQVIKSGGTMPSKIRILLAWEWQLRTGENWGARDAVAAHLKDLKAPFVLVREGQELEATANTLREWLLKETTAHGLVFNSKM